MRIGGKNRHAGLVHHVGPRPARKCRQRFDESRVTGADAEPACLAAYAHVEQLMAAMPGIDGSRVGSKRRERCLSLQVAASLRQPEHDRPARSKLERAQFVLNL